MPYLKTNPLPCPHPGIAIPKYGRLLPTYLHNSFILCEVSWHGNWLIAGGKSGWGQFDGFLGSEIWRRFGVTLDYSRKHMRLEPNASFSDPFEIDISGLTFDAVGADSKMLRIFKVRPDSPAAIAGLLEGDVLLKVDDQSGSRSLNLSGFLNRTVTSFFSRSSGRKSRRRFG